MKVEKVPDSTYDMIGGCDQQIKEIKEVGSGVECSRAAAAAVVRETIAKQAATGQQSELSCRGRHCNS